MKKNSFWNLTTTAKIYLLLLSVFFVFRFILFLTNIDRIDNSVTFMQIATAFFMGVRFDLVICGYIMFFAFILLTVFDFFNKLKFIKTISFYLIFITFSISFIVSAVDIPYFNQFFSRFTVNAFQWADNPMFVSKMILQEPRYWLYIIPLILAIILLYSALKYILSKEPKIENNHFTLIKIPVSIIFIGLIFIGIRGRIEGKSPIRVGTAYFCNNPFLNQLGLNPNFTLIRSYLDSKKEENKPIELMDENKAVSLVQQFFSIENTDTDYPILRNENVNSQLQTKHNVVIVIMESMSAAKMKRHGNNNHLTPFLDSISNCGYYFENAYTAGIHTFNGIFSTLFSYPALFRQHPMKESSMYKYRGIATQLRKQNYSTIYFTTHDGQFDNVEGFLKSNDYERIVSKKDYPGDKIKTTLGVPDDYMFEFSIPILNKLNEKQKPFLAVFMTASDHGPYYIPTYFTPKSQGTKNQIVEYADYSLRKLIKMSSKQPWFDNTLFVFIADHGAPINIQYDLSLDYNHTPLLFYAPKIITEGRIFSQMAGQIDVFPTIMGILDIPFENNTLGVNLLNHERPYIYFGADDKYGVIDNNWLLIVGKDKHIGLFKYKNNDLTNYASQENDVVIKMKSYAESNLQTFQYLLTRQKL